MTSRVVQQTFALGRAPYRTFDPFLFFANHDDNFPAGDERMAVPRAQLSGRHIGSDFSGKDGFSMYHGENGVPGFPVHPHRGFETITVTRKGLIDHSDSLKCTARYGHGDTQWMTAGAGIQHSEMFPLINRDTDNHATFYQLWINLPRRSKMCPPSFVMLWHEKTPVVELADANGVVTTVKVIAGALAGATPLSPPPHSYASQPDGDVAVWQVKIPAGGIVTLPPAVFGAATNRALYFIGGKTLRVGTADAVNVLTGVKVDAAQPLVLEAVGADADVLILQGKPIGEPVAQHGPFVMNTSEELQQTFSDFQRTHFGGWEWGTSSPTHARDVGRHCVHPDGRKEFPPTA